MKQLIILFIIPFQLFAAEKVSLEDCQNWARQNYPVIKNMDLWEKVSTLNLENIHTNYLPGINLNGQASHQSEVTNVPISIPGIAIPEVSKTQYKLYLDFKQTIWDGGLTAAQKELENAVLSKNLNSVETDLYQLNEKISKLWYSVMFTKNNKQVIETQISTLNEKAKVIESGIKNGILEPYNLDIITAEIIGLKQNITEMETGMEASLKVLSILTGKEINSAENFVLKDTELALNNDLNRPELELFNSQSELLDVQSELLDKTRKPKVFGFGQAGYGKPGLNMLSDDFDPYYLVGIGLNWKVSDWKKSKRDKQLLELQKEFIQTQEEVFLQNLSILLEQQELAIKKIKALILSDQQILELRKKITASSASKLANGNITSTDYLQDMQAETIAKIKLETHKIQLMEAKTNYQILKGL